MAENKLLKYNSKRNFDITKEPDGKVKRAKNGKLKFCVQRHEARSGHYDLRLELGGVALSWAVPKGPSFCTSDKRLAVRVEDHPVDYMEFEGIIPKGEYGGGTVMLWDEGVWTPRGNPRKGLEEGSLKFCLDGKRLKGDWALVRMKSEDNSELWLLIKERDEYAKKTAGISKFSRGIRSGKSMAEIAASGNKNPFAQAGVMLANLCTELPTDKGWIYELKYDGHRVTGFSEGGKTALFSRNGHSCTSDFSPAAKALSEILNGRAAVVDGEMVVAGENGKPDFGALQAYLKNKRAGGLNYVLFDLLALDGEDLRGLPLIKRKQKLQTLLKGAPQTISYSEHTEKMGKKEISSLKKQGFEGIVAKRKDSVYTAGRNGDWMKLKFRNESEFVIGGYSLSDDGWLRSVLVGFYKDGKLKFAGKAGTGFSEDDRRALAKEFKNVARKTTPFESVPKEYAAGALWVKPIFVAQVDYAEITSSGVLRQASFKGLRQDKPAKEITCERFESKESTDKPEEIAGKLETLKKSLTKIPANTLKTDAPDESRNSALKVSAGNGERKNKALNNSIKTAVENLDRRYKRGNEKPDKEQCFVSGVKITHPEKIMFSESEVTKLELAEYYSAAAKRMMPYIKDRFLSLVCCPSGISGEKFFRRHFETDYKGISQAPAEDEEYFYISNKSALIYLAQYNAVEFHIWGSRKSMPYRPDVMVFDLDPDEELSLSAIRKGARDLKSVLDGMGLKSFLKTSGGKGYHVAVPFSTGADGQAFRDFAKKVANLMESKYPNRYVSSMSKKLRKGKIFIDWQRNSPGATSVAPYSVRARKKAPVSMPISWEELYKVAPASITIRTALKRLEKPDPWANFFTVKGSQQLTL